MQVNTAARVDTDKKAASKLLLFADNDVVYNHLAKTGGTFVKSVLQEAVPKNNLVIRSEFESMTKKDRETAFTIGSIRNPCDYYVSLWAYGSPGGTSESMGAFRQSVPDRYYGLSHGLDTTEDLERFSQWLRYIMPNGQPGFDSARFAFSYSPDGVPHQFGNFAGPDSLRSANETLRNSLQLTIDAFDTSSVDCWVKTENLKDDLKRCLQAYEESAGGTVVDWDKFTKAMNSEDSQNGSQHQPCAFYYNDANKAFTRSTDKALFEKFDYDTCCAPSTLYDKEQQRKKSSAERHLPILTVLIALSATHSLSW